MPELYEEMYRRRFSFGANWQKFLARIDEDKIALAMKSLTDFLHVKDLRGKVFVDVGCGSGLFSLCAVLLGARKVVSMDVDQSSVRAALYLRKKHRIQPSTWTILTGSALDRSALARLGKADIVYSWGVLHHTGAMYEALTNVAAIVPKGKLFYVAIYNHHKGFPSSRTWLRVKRFYSARGKVVRLLMRQLYFFYFCAGMLAHRKNPISYILNYTRLSARGMDFFRDVEDWLGGYPYEYAMAKEMEQFFKQRGFALRNKKLTTREGCNEFLFQKR